MNATNWLERVDELLLGKSVGGGTRHAVSIALAYVQGRLIESGETVLRRIENKHGSDSTEEQRREHLFRAVRAMKEQLDQLFMHLLPGDKPS